MRPLVHPSIEDVQVEGILHALSDPVRVAIYCDLAAATCALACSTFLTVGDKPVPKSTLSQHFKILREAGLIRAERQGVEMLNTSRCPEIEARFPGLVSGIVNAYRVQAAAAAPSSRKTATKRGARSR